MSERRRPTRGERGALPDPIRGIRYGIEEPCGDVPAWRQNNPLQRPEPKPPSLWDRIRGWFT
ncbi:Uncharacterised protein [Mycobacteroides abscessus subsp. abscessus]|uniref:hypothetical protein n=1 Tax=Mycobacteroides abscessus TaxID=36809 RepID=UPI000928832E|nr:hypothetical protein [Mycobacteroides abscessus]SHP28676.1 Uncharacterised protein [Mycobacteroides abscessus subsp. abscessus]SHP68770.1 Uncharacterised protein [Mycobacteroides abscessus subsp. abscessus]SHY39285.1 Uncharacterised protein [Mycobacteroides abscessus subsp. abscessus]SKD93613.1 Uncharacterised protein [Mycobacteroides abscessus subsp. abscessus]